VEAHIRLYLGRLELFLQILRIGWGWHALTNTLAYNGKVVIVKRFIVEPPGDCKTFCLPLTVELNKLEGWSLQAFSG
jgi:hypothetical protein